MYKQVSITIKGVAPLLMRNGRLANPLNPIVKSIKELSKRRNKTDEDFARIAELEWFGGIYVDDNDRPIIPGEKLEALIIGGAKKHKMGPKAKAGIICDGNFPLIYDGPKKAKALFKDKRFTDCRAVKVQQSRIMRTRPIFMDWVCEFEVNYLPAQLNEDEVLLFVDSAGIEVGLMDYRPKFGRFERV